MRLASLLLLAALALRPAAAQTAAARAALAETPAAVVTSESRSSRSGLTAVWLRPAIDGIEVLDDPVLVLVDDAGAVVLRRGMVAGGTVESSVDVLGADGAAARATAALGVSVASARGASAVAPRRVFVRTETGLRLAYEVAVYPADPARWAVVRVDAATGAVLSERRLAVFENTDGAAPEALPESLVPLAAPFTEALAGGGAYRVVAPPGRSPEDGGRALVADPADALASPYGWHDTDARPGPEFTTTRGNNAHAFPDRNFDGVPDATGTPDGDAALAFDFPLDLAQAPEAYREASVTNAFFWVNHAHDIFYHYGFDEAGGNFQTNGYGRAGGAPGADPVRVLVQDGSAVDNAFILVPPDGLSPQLHLLESTRTSPRRDYALDTEVVVHEMAHGLTARLTGGPAENSCLSTGGEDMAEGWSDWYALMLTMRPGETRTDARQYSAYTGGPNVRIAPYSTDVAANALTYGSTVGLTAKHAIGTVWATVLWEMTWDLIDAHGFSEDLADARGAAGNQIALSLVTEALRLQPCRPGFVDGRNAILLADQILYQNAHYGLLQTAFARRGLGRGAAQGLVSTTVDNVESFVVETNPVDFVPPAAIADLVATADTSRTITLAFTAPGDDGTVGQATRYDVRYGIGPITPLTFESARIVPGVAAPAPAGSRERVLISGRVPNTLYFVAIRTFDAAGNVSPLTVTSVRTPSPPTPGGAQTVTVGVDTVAVAVAAGQVGRVQVLARYTGESTAAVQAFLLGTTGFSGSGFNLVTLAAPLGPSIRYPRLSQSGAARLVLAPASPDRDAEDAGYADVTLPFAFPLGALSTDRMRVSTDGYVAFVPGPPTAAVPDRLGLPALPNGVVAPYWADLRIAPGGGIYADTLADGRFAVEFDRMVVAGQPEAAPVSFAVTLARSGEVGFLYDRVLPGNAQALRGLEDASGAASYTNAASPADSTVELYIPLPAVLSVETRAFVVEPGATALFTVVADARALRPGRYRGQFGATSTGSYTTRDFVPLVVDVAQAVTGMPPPVEPPAVSAITLGTARPNPVRRAMAVAYALPEALSVRLAVYDARGREVAVLVEGVVEAGPHSAVWTPGAAASGLYVVRLVAGRDVRTTTVVVVR